MLLYWWLRWIQCSSLRYTLAFSTMVPVEDRLYLIGGAIGLQDNALTGSGKHIDVWDPDSQTWCLASMMSKPRHAHAAVFLRMLHESYCVFYAHRTIKIYVALSSTMNKAFSHSIQLHVHTWIVLFITNVGIY